MVHRFPITEWEYTPDIHAAFVAHRQQRIDEAIHDLERTLRTDGLASPPIKKKDIPQAVSHFQRERQREFPLGEEFFIALGQSPPDRLLFYRVSLGYQLRSGLQERGLDPSQSLYVGEWDIDPFIETVGNPHVAVNLKDLWLLFQFAASAPSSYEERKAIAGLSKGRSNLEGRVITKVSYEAGLVWGSLVCGTEDSQAYDMITLLKPLVVEKRKEQMAIFCYHNSQFLGIAGAGPITLYGSEAIFAYEDPYTIEQSLQAIAHVVPGGSKISPALVVMREPHQDMAEERVEANLSY